MSTRYFSCHHAAKYEGLFRPTEVISGILYGIAAVEDTDPALAQILVLVANPKLGVMEITEGEYAGQAQKKISGGTGSENWKPKAVPSSTSPVSIAPRSEPAPAPVTSSMKPGGVVTDTPAPTPEPVIEAGAPVPSVAEALQTGEVEPPTVSRPKNSKRAK